MDDEDDEDGFFVPHGYLSDGEGEQDDNEIAGLPKVAYIGIFSVNALLGCIGK